MKIFALLLISNFLIIYTSCSSKSGSNVQQQELSYTANNDDKIEVYYFHFTKRCATCLTLEAKTKEFIETLYPNQVKAGLITFQALNLDEENTKPVAKRLGVNGQTLLLVKGDRKIDLTTDGFLYAVVKPDKLREIINEKIDGLMLRQ